MGAGIVCLQPLSGLRLNRSKCTVAGINVDQADLLELARKLDCGEGQWPMKYLGLPLGGDPLRKKFWAPMMKKIAKRLEWWKKSCLSKGGRLVMIRVILSAIPALFLSLFRVLVALAQFIEAKMRNFLWEGMSEDSQCHLVPWEVVVKPKIKGGLEIGNIMLKNQSLVAKWLW